MKIIYIDNAATSWPKPEGVIKAMADYNSFIGSSSGRSGHRMAIDAARLVYETRCKIAGLFSIKDPMHVVFTKNATEALNITITGLLKAGDHVITSSMEHNSVMRPLRAMEGDGIEITTVECSPTGEIDPFDFKRMIKKNTRAIYLTHASNVFGTITPVAEVGKIARENKLVFCVDSAQTAGSIPIDVEKMNIDLLAFTGHKSLFGPQGTGGLYIKKGLENEIKPVGYGGTGSRSEFEKQPEFMPDKFESGTLNTIGIAGLGAGVDFIHSVGIDKIRSREVEIIKKFIHGLNSISHIEIYGPLDYAKKVPVVTFNINEIDPSDAALRFDEGFNIMSRPGLHCAPSAHKIIGTYPTGSNRFSFGYFNTDDDVDAALNAIDELSKT